MPMTDRLQIRYGRLAVEVVSVVFAVLVALAVDQWWEDRENQELADRMTEAIAREIGGNRAQLVSFGDSGDPDTILSNLIDGVAALRTEEEPIDFAVNWDVTLLSSAAWETAQLTRATQFLDVEQVVDLAEVYEFQRFYLNRQEQLVDLISSVDSRAQSDPLAAFLELRSRFAITLSLRRTLATIYACTLDRLPEVEGLDRPVSECPQGSGDEI